MKVELVMPVREEKRIARAGVYLIPNSFAQLAAVTPEHVDLKITDENLEEVDFDSDSQLVGLSVLTLNANRALEISKNFKEKGKTVVWGGMHPSVVDQKDNEFIDSFVVGEAENVWPRLIKDFEQGKLKKRYQSEYSIDLNSIPLPRKDIFQIPSNKRILDYVITQRGCFRDCGYCSATTVYGKRIRKKTIEKTIEEISNSPSKNIGIYDENLFNSRKYAFELLSKIGYLGKQYSAQLDPQTAQDESVPEMFRETGVNLAMIGFESVNPQNFVNNRKYVPPSQWKKIVDNFHRNDISVLGYFMVGFDKDGEDIFEKTKQEVQKANIDVPVFAVVTPFPGTKMYEEMKPRIFEKDWSKYDLDHLVFEPRSISLDFFNQGFADLRNLFSSTYMKLRRIVSNS